MEYTNSKRLPGRARGRPTIRPGVKMGHLVVRIAPDTLALARKAAAKRGVSLSDWVRGHIARMARLEQ